MSYDYTAPASMPSVKDDPDGFMNKLQSELDRIQQSAKGVTNYIQFKPLAAEPSRKYTDMLVYADGNNWDPGDGPGLYMWDIKAPATTEAWNLVGKQTPFPVTRPVLAADTTLYVSTSGNDANDGLSSGQAFRTIGHAIAVAYSYDLNFKNLTISIANGTYNEALNFSQPFVGFGTVRLLGNTGSPTSVTVGSVTSVGVNVAYGAILTIAGVRIVSGGGNAGLACIFGSKCFLDRVDFGANGGNSVYCSWGSIVYTLGAITVSASAATAVFLSQFGSIIQINNNVTFSGTLSYTAVCYMFMSGMVYINAGVVFSGGTISGLRFYISNGGMLTTSGVTISGTNWTILDGFVDGILYVNNIPSSFFVARTVSSTFTAGYLTTNYSLGSLSSGTFPIAYSNGNMQSVQVNGGCVLSPPSGVGTMTLDIVNGSGASPVALSGWTKITGDTFTSTVGNSWRCFISTGALGAHVHIQALF